MNSSNITAPVPCPDDRTGLLAYACFYFDVHGYLCLVICCFGVPTNILNIIILTKKKLRSPINTVLTGIAVSDVLTMACYLPFVIHFYIMHGPERTLEKYTFGWTWFLAIHGGLTLTTHTVSVWLGVIMAIMRYTFIRSMGKGSGLITVPVATLTVIAVYILSIVVHIPSFIFMKVLTIDISTDNITAYAYSIRNYRLGAHDETTLEAVSAWIFIIIEKILPCVLITLFGGLLLFSLHESKKRTISLKGAHVDSRLKQHKRTTMMLLAIILMFIVAELPSSIFVILSLTMESFFMHEYMLLADTLDLLALINNAINFILYCAMSRQFRDSLCEFACSCIETTDKKYQSVKSQTTNSTAMNTLTNNKAAE